ncbi:MAG TPA: hypothetical protein VHJ76_00075 [Actinomycetota bacterium]|nr:hypothetical protein [Actinomycetota bacterium]
MAAPVLRPLRVGEVLDVAIKIYSRNFLTLWKIVGIIVLPVNVLGAIVALSTLPDEIFDPTLATQPGSFESAEREFWTFFGAQMLLVVIGIVTVTIATGACMKAVADVYLGGKPQAGASLRFAGRRVHSLVWITFLVTVLATLALLALIVPGVWLWVSWTVAPAVLIVEGRKGLKAMRRSFRLVKERWWPVFAATLVGFLLAGIVSGGLAALTTPLIFTDVEENLVLTVALDTVVNTIGGVLTTPFQAALVAVIYFDLRVRKEGFDLELLAQGIGTAPDPSLRPDFLPPPPPPAGGEKPPFWPPPPGWKPGDTGT